MLHVPHQLFEMYNVEKKESSLMKAKRNNAPSIEKTISLFVYFQFENPK